LKVPVKDRKWKSVVAEPNARERQQANEDISLGREAGEVHGKPKELKKQTKAGRVEA